MHTDDEKWVKNKINELPTVKIRLLAWKCYQKKYKEYYDIEQADFRKSNAARKAANTALRLYVDKVKSKITGQSS